MGLFDKKYCDICGGKIGLLGNRKLDDGNLCKDCAAKLSPWFSERRSSTVAQIAEQLNYRESNRQAVAAFNTTASYGQLKQLLIDEYNGKFMVANTKNYANENPDVVDLSQITGVDVDVRESKTEEKRKDANGNMVSYNPPKYTYSYDWYLTIRVNHPYFDDMTFKLNSTSVKIEPGMGMSAAQYNRMGMAGTPVNGNARLAGMPTAARPGVSKTNSNMAAQINRGTVGQSIGNAARVGINNAFGNNGYSVQDMAMQNPQYQSFNQMAEEIKMRLRPNLYGNNGMYGSNNMYAQQNQTSVYDQAMQVLQQTQQAYQTGNTATQAASAAPVKKTCPVCGANDYPEADGTCPYCGSPM